MDAQKLHSIIERIDRDSKAVLANTGGGMSFINIEAVARDTIECEITVPPTQTTFSTYAPPIKGKGGKNRRW